MKLQLSNIDVFAVAKELKEALCDGFIDKLYEVEDLLILKFRTKNGPKNLIIKNDSRVNLSNYEYPIPKHPSQYCTSLRKFLKNRRVLDVYQYKLDRILIIELSEYDNAPWKFLIELFAKGNFILLDGDNLIRVAKRYKIYKDRAILAKREYVFPPSRGIDLFSLEYNSLSEIFQSSNDETVRIIARNINIAGQYSEEICKISQIDKKKISNTLSEEEIKKIFESLINFRERLNSEKFHPQIVFNDKNEAIDVIPFELYLYDGFRKQEYESFNIALDNYFSSLDSTLVRPKKFGKLEREIAKLKKRLDIQSEFIEEQKEKKEINYQQGDLIYENFNDLENLLNTIVEAKNKKYSWKDIEDKLLYGKEQGIKETLPFKQILSINKQVVVNLGDKEIILDFNKSIGENANKIYSKGKKAQKKIDGTIKAIEETKEKIFEMEQKKENEEDIVDQLVKKPKKRWYERYRWFFSSSELLVVGGRDASSNETIYKKYIESNDIILHSEIRGSPLAVIKNPENKDIPDLTIEEAAIFVGSYSKAWKEGYKTADIFYVKPDQISKTPPSGEYLSKGSFIISGKKNFVRNSKLELAIGLTFEEIRDELDPNNLFYYPKVFSGPTSIIKNRTQIYCVIIPVQRGKSAGAIAKELKSIFLTKVDKEMEKWVKILKLDDIILLIPAGDSEIIAE